MNTSRLLWFPTLLLGLVLSSGSFSDGPVEPRFPSGHITVEQLQQFMAEVKIIPDIRCANAPEHQLICHSGAQRTIWGFTVEGQPAHPAVLRVLMVRNKSSH